ncbi:unnamed protein product [Paramecium pentaurelia]|uniref:Uncharacterized protein n=1 Tax=Paramecium pentaurelia TaxID=43138 RepID=A0A8S1W5Y1_9CILI|nr:unnamed protein product [Paramecium pentaurelia]
MLDLSNVMFCGFIQRNWKHLIYIWKPIIRIQYRHSLLMDYEFGSSRINSFWLLKSFFIIFINGLEKK